MQVEPNHSCDTHAPTKMNRMFPSFRFMAIIIAALSAIGPFSIDTYLPSFHDIGVSLNASPIEVQQTLTVYMAMFAVMSLWHGSIADAIGRRSVILAGLALFMLASLFWAFATRIEMLWIGRALQGLVGGVGMVVGRAVIRDLYDGVMAQRLMASVAVAFALAPAIAPVLGGQLQRWFAWQGIFIFLALLAVTLFFVCWRYLPETLPPEKRQAFSPRNLWQGYRSMFRSAPFVLLSLAMASNFAGFFIYVLSSPVFLIEHLHLSPQAFAWLFIPAVAGLMLGSVINGRLAGRLSPRRTIACGYVIMMLAAAGNVGMNYCMAATLPWAIVPVFVYVIGMAMTLPCLQLLAMDLFPARHGMASSCQATLQSLVNALVAGVVAPWLWGSTLTLALGMAGFMATGLWLFDSSHRIQASQSPHDA